MYSMGSGKNIISCLLWLCCCCWFVFMMRCWAESDFGSNTILQTQQLRDSDVMRSANGDFRLQFFSPGSSKNRYLGIYFHLKNDMDRLDDPVWVGNRNDPIYDSSGTLVINATTGMLNIQHNRGIINLPTNTNASYGNINTSATLQDDGNLVLRQVYPNGSISGVILWQSFDYPTDTLLPGMKLGRNFKTGHEWLLTSWVSKDVPSSGSFTLGMDRNNTNLLFIWFRENVFWNSRVWHNNPFENSASYDHFIYRYISNKNETYLTYLRRYNEAARIRLYQDGSVLLQDRAAGLLYCGNLESLNRSGCANYSFPMCKNGDHFDIGVGYYNLFGPYGIKEDYNHLSLADCEAKCKQNCSCLGYASLYENGTGCIFWDNKDDVEIIAHSSGQPVQIYLRLAENRHSRRWRWWAVFLFAFGAIILLLSTAFFIQRKCFKKGTTIASAKHIMADKRLNEENEKTISAQIHQFSFETIQIATNNFSMENKLGEGGFGPVYKGKLLNAQEIAIKRLSTSSSQGPVEFKNEIQLIVKLQHNNLVRLLGCCIHKEEMMLVYEYMPNKSLDFFLFDPKKGELLKWTNRMNIIEGIAQGLLYLHKHSRLRVIHRDLKASNVLLDQNMTPKISDFGMARIFGIQDSEDNTKRIVGTHGYMSPEYAIKGVVSTKMDVFSFGVLVLEIVSGKKNHRSYHSERPLNLIGLAWELWIEKRAIDLVDMTIDVSSHLSEIKRCINVGLLCVQDSATDRPSMADVILMLKNESLKLPPPKQPAFFIETNTSSKDIDNYDIEKNCTNSLSTSIMEAR